MPDEALTLDQVLAITYTAGHTWSPDGSQIGFIHDDGGRFSLRVADVERHEIVEVSQGDEAVTEFGWGPAGELAYVQGGKVLLTSGPHLGTPAAPPVLLYAPTEPVSGLTWAPVGRALACVSGGRAWVIDLAGPSIRDLRVPGRARALYHEPPLVWAPDAGALAVGVVHGSRWDLAVVGNAGNVVWQSETEELEGPVIWLRANRLLYAQASVDYTARHWWILDVDDASTAPPREAGGRLVWTEREPEGLGASFAPQALPDGSGAVMMLRHEGWWHPYVLDAETGTVRALSRGAYEDVGHAVDLPRVSPDGREVVFSSNRVNLGQRHLIAVDLETATARQLTPAAAPASSRSGRPTAAASPSSTARSTTHRRSGPSRARAATCADWSARCRRVSTRSSSPCRNWCTPAGHTIGRSPVTS